MTHQRGALAPGVCQDRQQVVHQQRDAQPLAARLRAAVAAQVQRHHAEAPGQRRRLPLEHGVVELHAVHQHYQRRGLGAAEPVVEPAALALERVVRGHSVPPCSGMPKDECCRMKRRGITMLCVHNLSNNLF